MSFQGGKIRRWFRAEGAQDFNGFCVFYCLCLMCCLRVHELQRDGDSRFISLANSRVTIRGTALTARKLTALVHCQFRAPLGAAREESLRC